MGKIQFKFLNDNKDEFSIQAFRQALERVYGISKMEKLEFEGDDKDIIIDPSEDINNIRWENLNYPNDEIKSYVIEIAYYFNKANDLKEIIDKIQYCRPEEGFTLKTLGESALNIINNLHDPKFITLPIFAKEIWISTIKHTLNQEVNYLENLKPRTLQSTKNKTLYNAKSNLECDIETAIIGIKTIKEGKSVNEEI